MKRSFIGKFLASSLCLSAVMHAGSSVDIRWNIGSNVPSTGVSELDFPMEFTSTPDAAGLYFAFYFETTGHQGPYTGFQPRSPSAPGKHTFQLVFSSFSSNATSSDSNCYSGADNGPGISCSTKADFELGHWYRDRVTVTTSGSNSVYNADLYDDTTNTEVTHIGSFDLPASAGGGLLKGSDGGFIEPIVADNPYSCQQSATAYYGQVYGVQNGTKYTGTRVTGSNTTTCAIATFTASGANNTQVVITGSGS